MTGRKREATTANTEKPCKCHKSSYRDPECEKEFPVMCPWRELDLARMILAGDGRRNRGNQ